MEIAGKHHPIHYFVMDLKRRLEILFPQFKYASYSDHHLRILDARNKLVVELQGNETQHVDRIIGDISVDYQNNDSSQTVWVSGVVWINSFDNDGEVDGDESLSCDILLQDPEYFEHIVKWFNGFIPFLKYTNGPQ